MWLLCVVALSINLFVLFVPFFAAVVVDVVLVEALLSVATRGLALSGKPTKRLTANVPALDT